jgi:hypothetical protein
MTHMAIREDNLQLRADSHPDVAPSESGAVLHGLSLSKVWECQNVCHDIQDFLQR